VLRIANYFESRLGRADGNPTYLQACLKRLQYHLDIVAGKPANNDLLPWFGTQDSKTWQKDPRAEASAKEFFKKYGDTFEIDHIYPTGDISMFGTYDLNIHVDWGEDGLTGFLPYTPIKTPHPMAYWASDTHLGYDYRLSQAKNAEFAFCAQKQGINDMLRDGVKNPIWLPHAVEPLAYPKQDKFTKNYDVCFIGHVNSANREKALDRLFSEFPNFDYGQALFEKAAERIGNSKIGFNIAMKDDINMRCFETMATGTMLLTDRIPHIEELFEDKKHLVLYDNLDDMVEKAKYYLDHDDEREKIAQAGYEEVMAKHTIQARADVILNEFMKSRVPVLA
jgi:hypothetical protein